jgi:hypothetical protein
MAATDTNTDNAARNFRERTDFRTVIIDFRTVIIDFQPLEDQTQQGVLTERETRC